MPLISYTIVTAVGGVVALLCPPLTALVANLFGISSTGIAAGGMAAAAQSHVGNVVAGSVIAILQRAAMTPVAIVSFTFKSVLIVLFTIIAIVKTIA